MVSISVKMEPNTKRVGYMDAHTVDLVINDAAIKFEVALEILGQERQPFMAAIRAERTKPAPSQAMIRYCEMRLAALDELQGSLRTDDAGTVSQILDMKNWLFRS